MRKLKKCLQVGVIFLLFTLHNQYFSNNLTNNESMDLRFNYKIQYGHGNISIVTGTFDLFDMGSNKDKIIYESPDDYIHTVTLKINVSYGIVRLSYPEYFYSDVSRSELINFSLILENIRIVKAELSVYRVYNQITDTFREIPSKGTYQVIDFGFIEGTKKKEPDNTFLYLFLIIDWVILLAVPFGLVGILIYYIKKKQK